MTLDRHREQLLASIEALADLGEKRAGTPAGESAAEWLRSRFAALGLDAALESFGFPRHRVGQASLELWDRERGPLAPVGFQVLEASGEGRARGPLVWAGSATPELLAELEPRGAIAIVESNRHYHRSTQVTNLCDAGARAMLYVSSAPDNLRQAGSVRARWEGMAPIPTLSIGARDGAELCEAIRGGARLEAEVDVRAHCDRGRGHNVVARLPGRRRGAESIVVGAHFDTWFAGACDNGGGVAAMLALAQLARDAPRMDCDVVFVGFDGEELALYGGYEFLRRRRLVDREGLRAVINLETPSATGTPVCGLAYSKHAAIETALGHARLPELYPLYVSMDAVPQLFGGIIPADIQGFYREGVPTVSTAVDAPYYHTAHDTPDKVDLRHLAEVTRRVACAIERLAVSRRGGFAERDPTLWRLWTAPRPRRRTEPLRYRVQVTDGRGVPQSGARVDASLLYDGFHLGAESHALTDTDGYAELALDAHAADADAFVHLTAGRTYPLVELVRPADASQR
jgi:hypothetical protein